MNFPNNPTNGQTTSDGDRTWVWNALSVPPVWKLQTATPGDAVAAAQLALSALAKFGITPPVNPPQGAEWVNPTTGRVYKWSLNDNGAGQWIETGAIAATGIATVQAVADLVATLNGYDGSPLLDLLDQVKTLFTYTTLRTYTGRAKAIRMGAASLNGVFTYDPTDTTTADNGGTVIVDGLGRRWKRAVGNSINIQWFNVRTGVDTTAALLAVRDWYAAQTQKPKLVWPAGTYTYSTSPNWAIPGLDMEARGDVVLNYTGSGTAFNFDSFDSASPNTSPIVFDVRAVGNFIVDAPNAMCGLYNRNVTHAKIDVRIKNLSNGNDSTFETRAKAAYIMHAVCNDYRITCSVNEYPTMRSPFYGIVLGDASTNGTRAATANRFLNPVIEGPQVGIYLNAADQNTFDGGTSEACGIYGLLIDSGKSNEFRGMGFEANGVSDILLGVSSWHTHINNCYTGKLIDIQSQVVGNKVTKGIHKSITIGNLNVQTVIQDLEYGYFGGGVLTDNAPDSTILNVRNLNGIKYPPKVNGQYVSFSGARAHDGTPNPPIAINPTGSPYTYQNTNDYPLLVFVRNGTVSLIEFVRGVYVQPLGGVGGMPTAGTYTIPPGDTIRLTYSAKPDVVAMPM